MPYGTVMSPGGSVGVTNHKVIRSVNDLSKVDPGDHGVIKRVITRASSALTTALFGLSSYILVNLG